MINYYKTNFQQKTPKRLSSVLIFASRKSHYYEKYKILDKSVHQFMKKHYINIFCLIRKHYKLSNP